MTGRSPTTRNARWGVVGLIMLGSQQVHPTSPGITNLLCNYDDGIIPGLARIARGGAGAWGAHLRLSVPYGSGLQRPAAAAVVRLRRA